MKLFNTKYKGTESNLSMANLFKVAEIDDEYIFDINRTINFEGVPKIGEPNIYYEDYQIRLGDTWMLISYRKYGHINLWWLICKINNIIDPTIDPVPGNFIKIFNADKIDVILNSIKNS